MVDEDIRQKQQPAFIRLLALLHRQPPGLTAARPLIDSLLAEAEGVALRPGWRESWAIHRAVLTAWFGDVRNDRIAGAYHAVFTEMVRFVLDGVTAFHQEQCRRSLCDALLGYLSLRGVEVTPELPAASHSPDFRTVTVLGEEYHFTPNQAAIVRVLWEARENKAPEVGTATLLAAAECDSERVPEVFKQYHRDEQTGKRRAISNKAWGTIIVEGSTKGSYRLNLP